ncbi:MAG: hypothetical protein CSA34_04490 [Desulfobulbus propionicus]|nr:MAG: hypothetical protein CSA34_04490 [Desulfobulbus propionicus]
MKAVRMSILTLIALVCLGGTAASQTITVDLNDPDYYRPFYAPELVSQDGAYQADFTDNFVFTLAEGGALSFTLSERNNRSSCCGSPEDWVDITSVGFTSGNSPSSVTPWENEDPYYPQSNLVSSYAWDYLAAGTYELTVAGSAYAGGYPQTHYWMEDVSFVAGVAPVPEPATLLLFGSGIAGLTAMRRRKK